jgi:transcriptional regulator with XRE-family HTH domain
MRRRTPGLRREEVATIAGVGVTWYTWLEQGRDIRVSAGTLERIATALRLTPTDITYLFSLAGVPRLETPHHGGHVALDAAAQCVLDAFRAPAFIVGPCWDVHAFNHLADCIYLFHECSGDFWRNHMWRFFMDPMRRALYLDWSVFAVNAAGVLRTAYSRRVGDPYFDRLVRALIDGSTEFKELWNSQHTAPLTSERVRLLVRGLGELHVISTRLQFSGSDDHLLILLPPADEQSAGMMERIARDRRPRHNSTMGTVGVRLAKTRRSKGWASP